MSKTKAIVITNPTHPAPMSAELAGRARKYIEASKADSTQRAYAGQWAQFVAFCAANDYDPLPASVVAVVDYLTALADGRVAVNNRARPDIHGKRLPRKVSQIEQARAAIGYMHNTHKVFNPATSPEVKVTMKGIRRKLGVAVQQKAPATLDLLRPMIAALPDDLRGQRDKALLLIGFAGAFRRSELTALEVGDVRFTKDGASITIQRSKSDQEGAGMFKRIPYLDDVAICPVRALRAWLNMAAIQSGRVFRAVDQWGHIATRGMSGQEVARIVKRAAIAAGVDHAQLAGHSLRAGFVTEAAQNGVPTYDIKEQSGHKRDETLQKYVRQAGRGAMRAVRSVFGEGAN
jgi:integrase